jgi:glycerol-3-phosphate dehydrogenase
VIRDLPRLAEREFDVLVTGGGIYGLTLACDAAQRGLSVALVERSDFGGATSFNHLKTLHGGLRYLQSADLPRMRESIRERRAFARIAPRFVAPVMFAMPTQPSLTRSALAMKMAFALDAMIAADRNVGVGPAHRLPSGRVATGSECRDLFENAIEPVASAAVWHDYETTDGDRLTFAFAKAAAQHGAVLANYTEASGLLLKGGRAAGVEARDVFTGERFAIRARVVVNAAGPWSATLLRQAGLDATWPLLKAMNLVTSRPARRAALVASMRGGRGLVMLPWRGRTVIGTSESGDARQPDDQDVRRGEVLAFLRDINETFPALGLHEDDITLVHRGIVPAAVNGGGLTLAGRSRIIDHATGGVRDLVTIVGVKYTTARAVAQRAVDVVLQKLGRGAVGCRTASTLLPGAGMDDRDPADPVAHAIEDEMAQTLSDVVVRRTGLGAAGYPGDDVADNIALRMQQALGWTDSRRIDELRALKAFYEISPKDSRS